MTDDGDTSAHVERFAADVDAKLRRLRDELEAAQPAAPVIAPPPAPPRVDAPAPEPEPVTAAPERAATPPAERRWPRRLATTAAFVLLSAVVVTVLATSIGPEVLPYKTYVMRSTSMTPSIPRWSLVIATETDGDTIRVGDIITFEEPGRARRITHRVTGIDTSGGVPLLITKGDHNANADPWRVRADGIQIRYRVHLAWVGLAFAALASTLARVALIAVSLAVLVYELRRGRSDGPVS
jgi:signal peptidase I